MNQRDLDIAWLHAELQVETMFEEFECVWLGERMEQDEEVAQEFAEGPLEEMAGLAETVLGQTGAVDKEAFAE